MHETIQDSVTRLLRYQRAPVTATRIFRDWKHNSDILPRLQAVLEMLLDAYGKFEDVVYDMQGILDDGSDIGLRCRPQKSDEPEMIAFQVKSYDDLADKNYMRELKAQRDDSFRKVSGLSYYFIILCTDIKAHKDRIRNIEATFRTAYRTEVIEPEFAYSFLHHPRTRIEALVKRIMEADDIVLRRALDSIELDSPSARALAVFLAVKLALTGMTRFSQGELVALAPLRSIYKEIAEKQDALLQDFVEKSEGAMDDNYEELDEYYVKKIEPIQLREFGEQIAADLDLLEADFIELDPNSDGILLCSDRMRPLLAVVTDALVRYEYHDEQLISYMFDLMVRD